MDKERENFLIEKNLELLNETPAKSLMWTSLRSFEAKHLTNSEMKMLSRILEIENLVVIDSAGFKLELTKLGRDICANGGWTSHLKNKKNLEDALLARQKKEEENLDLDLSIKKIAKKYDHKINVLNSIIGLLALIITAMGYFGISENSKLSLRLQVLEQKSKASETRNPSVPQNP